MANQTSSQYKGIGRYFATSYNQEMGNNKFKNNNQNCKKIELYGSPTTTELKEHSSRLVGGVEMRSLGGKDTWQGGAWQVDQVAPHLHVDKPGGTTGDRDRPCNPWFQCRKRKPEHLYKNLWCWQREKLPASKESLLEIPTGS